ncbi:aminoglycoside 6'-N-acetyltransferase [Vallitalea okinawensis]|uniref:aminoglycoside 6'-N-acetyltransferase n=1 Tax=Vallitalea okinawensis TaxID=2078660 RepID=UPI000CFBF321|nr:aminoglycoside 6'-N-acetyltransferase [Vallitalea okinawensis]
MSNDIYANIKVATIDDLKAVVKMALELWPDNLYDELKKEFKEIVTHDNQKEEVLLYQQDDNFIGFIHVAIRNDYVEGTDFSPTGYIEGIYVKSDSRMKGIAKTLVKAGEGWAKEKGCRQMASDVELHNEDSIKFHKRINYREVNRVVCFLNDID